MTVATATRLRRVDAHIHLFENGFREDAPPELEHYEVLRQASSIDDALVIGYEGLPRFVGNNSYILMLAREHEWIHPLRFIDVTAHPSETLSTVTSDGYSGVSLYLPADQTGFTTWSPGQVDALGAVPLVSINAGIRALAAHSSVIQTLSDTSLLLLSHLGSPGPTLAGASGLEAKEALAPLLSLARLPNTVVKLSGLYDIDRHYPHKHAQNAVRTILDTFGPQRLVWGSDFSPALDATSELEMMSLPDWLTLTLDSNEIAAVLGGTLRHHLHRIRIDREDRQ